MNFFAVAVKNLGQNALRSTAVVVAIATLSAVVFSLSLIYSGLARSIELSRKRLGADAMIVPAAHSEKTQDILLTGSPGSFTMKDAEPLRRGLLRTDGVEAVTAQLFIISAPLACCSVSDTMLIGYEPETDFVIGPWIREHPGRARSAPNGIVVGANILAGVGGRQKFYGQEFLIVGKLEPVGMRFIDNAVFIPMAGARRMIAESGDKALRTLTIRPEEVSAVLVKLRSGANAEQFALRFEYDNPQKKVLLASNILNEAKRTLAVPLKGMAILFILQWAVSLFLISVIHKMSLDERTVELGILKALGASNRDLAVLLVLEMALLSAAGSAAGLAAGLLIVHAFSGFIMATYKTPFLMPDAARLAALAIGVFAASLASGTATAFFTASGWATVEPFFLMRGGRTRKGELERHA